MEHHIGLDDHAAVVVRRADHAAFGDGRMGEERGFHLRPGDVVARRHDHVVRARLVPEIAVLIHEVRVAGDVPAILHVFALALVLEIAATGRTAHGQAAQAARRQLAALLVEDLGLVSGHRLACGAGADLVLGRRDEDVEHLGRADPVHQLDAGRGEPGVESAFRQGLAGGDAFAQ